MKVAVSYETGTPLVVEDVPTPAIGPRDVLMTVAASGICHTDVTMIRNAGRTTPVVPGHEACGIVEAVGPEVRRVKAGDRVLASVAPACGACWPCTNGMSQHCERGALVYTPRFELPDGRKAPALCGCGSFADAMVVDEASVVAVHTDLPDEQLALLGCGVTTGLGAVLNTARVAPGSSVAVIGCGGVGQSVIQGARIAGASTVIAIDLAPGRRESSLRVGATHALDPAEGDPVERVRALTGGWGVDHSFEAVGLPSLMNQAFDMARVEGTVTLVGMPPAADAVLSLSAMMAVFSGRRLQGSVMGGSQILRDYPRYIRLAETGQLDLGSMVSRRITLDRVNDGIALLDRAEGVRSVIVPG
ncbi:MULTISPECIES: Zn-dependent alcohol dehydrogenase [unclassified Streptomyces]|uniref:Zn-dependent alcohol dehydrogenase n=1 Tax=unclassified Streptomyces TaxID=2593676 RepID=UPI0037F37199